MSALLLPEAERLELGEVLAHYQAHGFARLGRILTDEAIASLAERADDLMLGRVVHEGLFFQMDAESGRYEDAPLGLGWQGPSLRYRKLEKLEKDERFRALLQNPLFERIARARLGSEHDVVLYRAILFHKGEGGGSEVPWHQDGGKLWGLTRDPELQLWVALTDAPLDGGCLEVLPGTHRQGLATPLGGVVPPDKLAQRSPEQDAVALPVKAGEAILLHNHVWHRSQRSQRGVRRLGFSACFMSSEVRCVRTKKAPRTFFKVF